MAATAQDSKVDLDAVRALLKDLASKGRTDEALDLASGFVPDKRALKPLIRFRASAQDWKLEFERSGLRSGSVQYDKASNTLVLTNVPDALKQLLLEE